MNDLRSALQNAVGDRYRIGDPIGRGGAGEVFRAEDVRHDRDVAIKVLLPDVARVTGGARFEREIRLAARLQHPHILPVFDSGTAGGLLYYVMPLVEGESLEQRLEREACLSIEDSRRICSEAAEALAYAHRHGVIHRDIKPGNLLLSEGGVLVADFGVAMAVTPEGEAAGALTRAGIAIGSPAYMSPEQSFGDEDVDGRSDIYSLGCVLYQCLTGQPPFVGTTTRAILAQHASAEPVSPRALRPEIPATLERDVLQSLEKRPADRFPDAESLAAALEGRPADRWRLRELLRRISRRAVLNAVALYLAAVLLAVLVTDFLADRLLLAPGLPGIVGAVLLMLTPAIVALAYFGRRGWRLALAPVALTVAATSAVAMTAFEWDDLMPPVAARSVITAEGLVESRRLPVPAARRRVAIFPLAPRGGEDADWRSRGLALGLKSDLHQDQFFDVETDFSTALEQQGLSGAAVPGRALMMSLARSQSYPYAVGGEYSTDEGGLNVRYDLYDVATGEVTGSRSLRETDWSAATDSASVWVRRTLGIPEPYLEANPGEPVVDLLTTVDTAFVEFALAQQFVETERNFAAAVPHLEAAVALDSTFAEAWASLTSAYMATLRLPEAREAVSHAALHRYRLPERRELRVRQAYAFLHGQTENYLRLLESYVSIFPDDLEERFNLADAYVQRGRLRDGMAQYDSILRLDPYSAAAEERIAEVLLDLSRPDSALAHIRRFRRLGAADPLYVGRLYERAGELDTARVLYEEAQAADPTSAFPLLARAKLERRWGRPALEREFLEESWEQADTHSERRQVALTMVRYFVTRGEVATAGEWWDVVATRGAEEVTAAQHQLDLVRHGDVLVDLGRAEEARALAASASAYTSLPAFGEFVELGRLQLYRALGEPDSVHAILDRYPSATAITRGVDSQRWILEMARGDLARRADRPSDATDHYRTAVILGAAYDIDRQLEAAWARAETLADAGSDDAAIRALRESLVVAPAHPGTHLRLARLLLASADTARAVTHLERAERAWSSADPGHDGAAEARAMREALDLASAGTGSAAPAD